MEKGREKEKYAFRMLSGKVEPGSLVNRLNWILLWDVGLLFEIEFTAELEMLVIEVRMVKMMLDEIESVWIHDLWLHLGVEKLVLDLREELLVVELVFTFNLDLT